MTDMNMVAFGAIFCAAGCACLASAVGLIPVKPKQFSDEDNRAVYTSVKAPPAEDWLEIKITFTSDRRLVREVYIDGVRAPTAGFGSKKAEDEHDISANAERMNAIAKRLGRH